MSDVVVVTGAASGIGRATVELLLEDNAVVVGVDVDETGLDETGAVLGSSFYPLVGDVGEWETHDPAGAALRRAAALSAAAAALEARSLPGGGPPGCSATTRGCPASGSPS
jgi:NAD(P)-dependent dehydrogenase (short-subunit alcohol dehydrogenase family)